MVTSKLYLFSSKPPFYSKRKQTEPLSKDHVTMITESIDNKQERMHMQGSRKTMLPSFIIIAIY